MRILGIPLGVSQLWVLLGEHFLVRLLELSLVVLLEVLSEGQ
jgi:hypothetical protein